jgi:TM2 domain-containing membrane protein YozV
MYCRNCANPVDDRAVACPKCGVNPRDGTAYCQACSKPTLPNQVVCRECLSTLARPYPVYDPRAGNKIAAGLCAILIGAFGVHKFVLGYSGAGTIMLLVTVLTCGACYPIMSLIGLIEGIIYLTKSDEDFVNTYVINQKAWF